MSDASLTILVLALRELEVDGVRIAEGETADIRRELVAGLVACGAVDDEVEQNAPRGDGGDGSDAGGSTEGAADGAAPSADAAPEAPAPKPSRKARG